MVIFLVLNNYKEGCKPQGDIGGNRLIGHDESAACLGDLAHLAVEVFYRACTVLAHHQTTDAVVGGVASAVVKKRH